MLRFDHMAVDIESQPRPRRVGGGLRPEHDLRLGFLAKIRITESLAHLGHTVVVFELVAHFDRIDSFLEF